MLGAALTSTATIAKEKTSLIGVALARVRSYCSGSSRSGDIHLIVPACDRSVDNRVLASVEL